MPLQHRLNWTIDYKTGTYKAQFPTPTGNPADPTLTSHGVRQSHELAAHIASPEFQPKPFRVYCSPFYRCLQTIQPTVEALKAKQSSDGDIDPSADFDVKIENGIGWRISPTSSNQPTGIHANEIYMIENGSAQPPSSSIPPRHRRLSPQDLRSWSQRSRLRRHSPHLRPRCNYAPPPKRTQPRREHKKILRGTIIRHRARQHPAHGNQRRRMRANKQRLAGALLGALRRLQGRDLSVHVGDYACEGGGDAVVQLGDGLAARGGDEVRAVS
ncbi:hypothetical protein CNMCM6106_003768 [Aspergillus hiratsukae]|uniref:Uncharacterized protein n=1 Tax=Aspergillus hiratsukae TaxID=1194566 RepID=A0A8H6UVK3_9EURO|nr:hypothetical protein CNMCM6106_003768 [Aspergillus hiratsukae]